MGFIRNMRVSIKLSLLLAIYVIAITWLGLYFVSSMEKIATEIDEIAHNDLPLVRVVSDIELVHAEYVHQLDKALLGVSNNVVNTDTNRKLSSLSHSSDELIEKAQEIVDSALKKGGSPTKLAEMQSVKRQLEEIAKSHSGYEATVVEIVDKISNGQVIQVPQLVDQIDRDEVVLKDQIESLLHKLESFTQNAVALVDEREKQGESVVIWTVAGLLLFGVIFGMIIIRSITFPLSRLKQRFSEMNRSGDFSLRGDLKNNDEIGEMSKSLDVLLDTLENDLLKLRNAANTGDFSFEVVAKSDKDIFAKSLLTLQRVYADVIAQARTIAAGDFEASLIEIRSNDDQLGKALQEMTDNLGNISKAIHALSVQNFSHRIDPKSNNDTLSLAVNRLAENLEKLTGESELSAWFKSGQNELAVLMQGDPSIEQLSEKVIHFLSNYVNAQLAAIYMVAESGDLLELKAGYALRCKQAIQLVELGQGLVGQAALDRKVLVVDDIPEDYFFVSSALGTRKPRSVLILPFAYNDHLIGVIELASIKPFSEKVLNFLEASKDSLAIAFNSAKNRARMKELFDETTQQAHVLKEQQEELRASNEELEESAEALRAQSEETRLANIELEQTKEAIELKACELERASKYKSEFLANMSHELRTPLNSILLLARQLSTNRDSNLSEKQVRSSEIIYNSGKDLLALINEILDLSKIEAGKMRIDINPLSISDVSFSVTQNFQHVFEDKGLNFSVDVGVGLPETILTDQMRVDQILKNLVSNAAKFTNQGGVTVRFRSICEEDGNAAKTIGVNNGLAVDVSDTGIGISEEDQQRIFHAFQQADGGIDRRFGGTGLGLSISRELAKMLGGDICLTSVLDQGSTFTLYLPYEAKLNDSEIEMIYSAPIKASGHSSASSTPQEITQIPVSPKSRISNTLPSARLQPKKDAVLKSFPVAFDDDREGIESSDKAILIIEDDAGFSQIVQDMVRSRGFKSLVALNGTDGLELATKYQPIAIMLDINLPDMSGINVLNNLKDNLDTRHIPVQVMSVDDETYDAFDKGAIGYLLKPVDEMELEKAITHIGEVVDKDVKDLLVIEDNEVQRSCIIDLIGDVDVLAKGVGSGEAALSELRIKDYDCVILDLGLPDMTGFEFLRKLKDEKKRESPPVIVYTGRELTREENMELRSYSDSIVIKGVHSQERLLNEAMLFLHRMVSKLPEPSQTKIASLYNDDAAFNGTHVLLVDDDMRNLYALSGVLEERGIEVTKAENGKQALELLNSGESYNMVLMDIMMPEMNGYEAISEIRKIEKYKKLPIIALTAKAMQDDKDKCFEVGANDYLSKPIETDRLLSLMRVWIKSEIISS